MHIVGTGGANNFPSSYGGSNRGGGCKLLLCGLSDNLETLLHTMKYINKRNTTILLISILNTFSIHLINCTKYCDSVNVPAQASFSIPGTILVGGCNNLEQFQFGEEGRHLLLIKTNIFFVIYSN